MYFASIDILSAVNKWVTDCSLIFQRAESLFSYGFHTIHLQRLTETTPDFMSCYLKTREQSKHNDFYGFIESEGCKNNSMVVFFSLFSSVKMGQTLHEQ